MTLKEIPLTMQRLVAHARGRLFVRVTAVAFLLAACGTATASRPPINIGPTIRLDARTWDFGELPQHSQASHSFTFRNDGTAPLRIHKVDVDCGCATVGSIDSLLAPGESSGINVTFSSRTYEGAQRRIVALYTNDPAEPRIDLLITGNVKPFINVENRTLDFGVVPTGRTPAVSTMLTAEEGSEFGIIGFEGGEEHVEWSVETMPVPDGSAYRITATLRPDAPLGTFNERILVKLEDARATQERIFVRGNIHSHFILSQGRINFASVKTGRQITRRFRIDTADDSDYRITDVTATAPFLRPAVTRDGNGYELTVSLLAPDRPFRFQEDIILKTTDPNEPEIRIMTRGIVLE